MIPGSGTHNGVLLVAFVHGWHHNASPCDNPCDNKNNVQKFRKLLKGLAKTEAINSQKRGYSARKVLGMYVGWRGESVTIPVVNSLTFWERKNTAHKVGTQGVAEVFLKLEQIVNVKNSELNESADGRSRLVILGHSFGGAVVFTALRQILTDRFIDSRAGKKHQGNANGVGDFVVLVNPAFEAMRFAPLYDISQEKCHNFDTQLPKLAILTSEADWATGYAFPAGRMLSTLFETHSTSTLKRNYCNDKGEQVMMLDEGEADRKAIGHFEAFRTHRLLPAPKAARSDNYFQTLHEKWVQQKPAASMIFDGVELQHLNHTKPLNPYLNIYVDKELIGDHNDIWGDKVLSFLHDLIMLSTIEANNEHQFGYE
ncbi:MAG: lipase [Gammaproteobacteria bacterium]|nr:lipase [Gammaproteobacteria bacterium]